jgi:hypothetical protein
MFHYNFVAEVNRQGGPRGVTKFESANWFMPAAVRRVGPGTLELRAMLSAEPFTFPPGGSPLLFQTGETYKGEPLIDRQHPHDLFMELSASYSVRWRTRELVCVRRLSGRTRSRTKCLHASRISF